MAIKNRNRSINQIFQNVCIFETYSKKLLAIIMKKKVVIPLPSYGFDPTEAAIPWKILSDNNIETVFATPNGKKAQADIRMLTGKGLGIFLPLLKADKSAVKIYKEMEQSTEFNNPIKYDEIDENYFDGIHLTGGHDKGVIEYLESKILQNKIVGFFNRKKTVGAVCHGVLLAARSMDNKTGKSVLYDYKTTSLLKKQELLAYYLTKLWLKDYYLTYPETTVEDEVKKYLASPSRFIQGPIPFFRDSIDNQRYGFYVQDNNYISARWPGDIHAFSLALLKNLRQKS